jgi:hypothetical protein
MADVVLAENATPQLRSLFNKVLCCLHPCLQRRTLFDPDRAFAPPMDLAA